MARRFIDNYPSRNLLEAAHQALFGAGGSLPVTSLNKALFYLDLDGLLEEGRLITGAEHVAMKHGPIVAAYKSALVGPLEYEGIAIQDDDGDGTMPLILRLKPDEIGVLSESQIARARRVGKWASERTATGLSEFSHRNVGWMAAWRAGQGGGERTAQPINMRLAMQQLLDDDEWMRGIDAETAAVLGTVDDDAGREW